MSSLDLINELRSGRPAASESLRERVRTIGAAEPMPRRRAVTLRRAAIVLFPACLVALVGAGALHGLLSAEGDQPAALRGERAATATVPRSTVGGPARLAPILPHGATRSDREFAPQRSATGGAGSALTLEPQAKVALPPSGVRLQNYTALLRLHVANLDKLSSATKDAMRFTRRVGGYVASVDYGTGKRGQATLVLRIPVGHVQQAVVHFSGLGTILTQQVSIEDVQGQVNDQTKRIAVLRQQIAILERTLRTQTLDPEQRARLEIQLANTKARLTAAIRQKGATVRRARLARVSLTLTTEKEAAVPGKPGRIDNALDDAGAILAKEAAITLYVLVVAGPLLLLAGAALAGGRLLRRRGEQRLLERTT
jgi:uncharacterized protein DUF4349